MAPAGKKVLIIGPGFIGWNVLDLLVKEGYEVTGFLRRQEHADQLKASGASRTVLGGLDDKALITQQVLEHDVVIHTATADHLPSVEAVLDGVEQRADKGLHTIYIHTSGTSLIGDGPPGGPKTETVYHDNVRAEVDAVSDDAPHRRVDLAIIAARRRLGKRARLSIIMPPLIYGFNPAHGRISIQVPALTRYALKHGFAAHVGSGEGVWSVVHVVDLARAYVILLHDLESLAPGGGGDDGGDDGVDNPYYFCESTGDGEVSWRDIAATIGSALHGRGLLADAAPRTMPPETYDDVFGGHTGHVVGRNSRSRAVRLRALGWEPVEKDWRESFLQDELPVILAERGDWKTYTGYKAPVAS